MGVGRGGKFSEVWVDRADGHLSSDLSFFYYIFPRPFNLFYLFQFCIDGKGEEDLASV